MPTPKIEPSNVCELEQGIPIYQVPIFQMIAVNINANIIAMLCAVLWSARIDMGNKFMIPIATAIPPKKTPAKLKMPDQITATVGFRAFVYITVATALAVS